MLFPVPGDPVTYRLGDKVIRRGDRGDGAFLLDDFSHHLRRAPRSISLLTWSPSYRLTGRKTPPVRETPRTALRLSERADHCATGMLAPQPTRAPCNAALNACDPLEELKRRIAAGRRGAHRIRDDRFYPEIRLRSSSTTITGSTTRCINQVRCVVEQVEVSTVAWATLRRDWHLDETFLRTITSTLRTCVDVSAPLIIFNKSNSSHQSTSILQETLPQPSAPP